MPAELDEVSRKVLQLEIEREALKKIGVDHLMVEGGGTMNFELMRLGLVDELMLFVAPMIFGGANAPTPADGTGLLRDAAVEMKLMDVEKWEDGGVLLRYKIFSS